MAGGVQDEEGGFDWAADEDVVFLDDYIDEEEEDGNETWLTEERIHAGRDLDSPGGLPPNAPRSRVLASLLALAIFLGCSGGAFTAAYHRHVTDRRIADTLSLATGPSQPTIPGLAALGFQKLWHAQLEEQVVIPVLNHSPAPVMLLGAVLEEPGMLTAAKLTPVGPTRLKPGQAGTVTGHITVDCTQDPAAVFPFMDSTSNTYVPLPNTAALLVRARTEGGHVAEAALDPDADGPNLQERICQQEGFDITGVPSISAVGDPHTHTVRITLSVTSSADIPMTFRTTAAYTRSDEYGVSGLSDASTPEAASPTSGTLKSAGTVRVAFTIHVWRCPVQVDPLNEVYVHMGLSARGNTVDALEEAIALATPLGEACGEG